MALRKLKKIVGLSGNDYLYGSSLADYIYGLGGNDFMRGGRGNDFLYGGTGKDTAVFSGKFSDYDFSTVSGGIYVSHARGTRIDGRDFVARDVECLKFADRTINLTLNYKPVAKADTNGADTIIEKGGVNNGTAGDATATGNVLSNDTDIDVTLGRQTLKVANPGIYVGTYGTLQLTANGTWTYTLNDADADTEGLSAGQIAHETFFYTASDGKGGTAVGKLTLAIQGSNDAPVANSDTAAADENGAGALIDVLANDTDVDSDDDPATLKVIAASSAKGVPVSFSGAPGAGLVYQTDSTGIFEYLAAGETTTDTITYTIEDSHGAQSTSTVTVTITGTNDAPVVATADVTGKVTELVMPTGNLTDSGTIAFSDVDLLDTHAINPVVVASIGALGMLTASVTTQASDVDGTGGEITWDYSVAASAVEYLAAGETKVETFAITLEDGNGGNITRSIEVTITGTNDDPVVATADVTGAVTELVTPAGNLEDTGTITFSDVDLLDTHAINPVVVASIGALGTLTASVTTQASDVDGMGGEITWNYSVAASAVEYLAANETKVETFAITLEDGNGGNVTRSIEVTITGTNDDPIVATVDVTGAVTELVTPAGNLTDSGTIAFSDVDLLDTHSINPVIVVSIGALGTLTASVTTQASDVDGTGGEITWNYSVAASAVEYLAENETKVETFDITLEDGNGGNITRTVSITITGTNDAVALIGSPAVLSSEPVVADSTGFQDWGFSWRLADGGFVVAWADQPGLNGTQGTPLGEGGLNLQMRVYGPDGVPLSADIDVNQSGTGFYPRIASLGTDKFVVIWHSGGNGSGFAAAYGRIFNNDGSPAGDEFLISSNTSWMNVAETEFGFSVYSRPSTSTLAVQSFDQSGLPTGSAFTVNKGYGDWGHLSLGLSDGTHALFYQSNDGHLYFQKLSIANSPIGGPLRIDSPTATSAGFGLLEATTIRDGVHALTWLQRESGSTTVHAMLIDDNGNAIGPDIVVGNAQNDPRIVRLETGGFAIAWRNGSAGNVQLFDANGIPVGTTQQVTSSSGSLFSIAPTTDGGVVATWVPGAPSGGSNVLASYVSSAGTSATAAVDLSVNGLGQSYHLPIAAVWSDGSIGVVYIDRTLAGGVGVEHYITRVVFPAGTSGALSEEHPSTSGVLHFTDPDLSDTHTVVFSTSPANSTALGTFALAPVSEGVNSANGTVGWTYTIDNAAAQYLAQDQDVTETYTITIDDGHGSTRTQDVVVTITGTNDAPAVATADVTGGVTELVTPAGSLTDSGTIAFSDDDLLDSHTINPLVVASGGALGTLTASVTTQASDVDGTGGEITWDYSVAASAVEYLAAGETKVETFAITLEDGNGGNVTRTIEVTITGTNDAPVITSSPSDATGSVTEDGSGGVYDHALDDWWLQTDLLGGLRQSTTDPNFYFAVASFGIWTPGDTFEIPDGYRWATTAEGQSVFNQSNISGIFTYYNQGGWSGYQWEGLSRYYFRFSDSDSTYGYKHAGNYDEFFVQFYSGTENFAGLVLVADSSAIYGDDVATGLLTATDVDLSDTLTWTIEGLPSTTYGNMSIDSVTGEWTFTLNSTLTAVQALDDTEVVTEQFTARVTDSQGSYDEQVITIEIAGRNDAPTVVALAAMSIGEDGGAAVDLLAGASDIDVEAISVTGLPVTITTTGGRVLTSGTHYAVTGSDFNLTAAGYALFNNLAQGTTDTFTLNFGVTDGTATTPNSLSVTVNGANDDPVANNDTFGIDLTGYAYFADNGHYYRYVPAGGISFAAALAAADAAGGYMATATSAAENAFIHQLSGFTSPFLAASDQAVEGQWRWVAGPEAGTLFWLGPEAIYGGSAQGGNYANWAAGEPNNSGNEDFIHYFFGGGGLWNDGTSASGYVIEIGGRPQDSFVTEDAFVDLNVLANDTDVDAGTVLSVSSFSATSANGAAISLNGDGTLRYDPTGAAAIQALGAGEVLNDTFSYTVSDGSGGTDTATVSIVVGGVNDAPEFTDADDIYGFGPVNENQAAGVFVGQVTALDVDSPTVTYAITGGNTGNAFTIDANGNITTTGALDFEITTSYALTVTASDGSGGIDTAMVNVGVGNVTENAGLLGKTLDYTYYFPDLSNIFYNTEFVVGSGVEVPGHLGFSGSIYTTDFTNDGLIIDFLPTANGGFGSGSFNGFRIFDEYDTIASFSAVNIMQDNLGVSVTFDANNVYVNWQGRPFNASTLVVLDFDFI